MDLSNIRHDIDQARELTKLKISSLVVLGEFRCDSICTSIDHGVE